MLMESFKPLTADQQLESYLLTWRAYMRRNDNKMGFPAKSIGLHSGYTSKSFDEFCEELDLAIAKAMDSAIEGLVPTQRAAICHRYLHAVFRFPRGYEEALSGAKAALILAMRRKGFA